jgi:hypothetical protein
MLNSGELPMMSEDYRVSKAQLETPQSGLSGVSQRIEQT